jgi:DNA-binding MarR family transcriptional regulator
MLLSYGMLLCRFALRWAWHTQGFIAEMLGAQRSYATPVISDLVKRDAIEKGRGKITIKDRRKLERTACECYARLRQHYDRVLPGVYPHPAE